LFDACWAEDNPGMATLPATIDKNVLRVNMAFLPEIYQHHELGRRHLRVQSIWPHPRIPGWLGVIVRLTETLPQRDSIMPDPPVVGQNR
jgi:hypothetical protein